MGPRRPAITTAPKNRVVLPTVTTAPSSQSSPLPDPHLPDLFHLQQFGKTLSLTLSLSLSLCKFHFVVFAYMIMLIS
jgi:hypothetical protein